MIREKKNRYLRASVNFGNCKTVTAALVLAAACFLPVHAQTSEKAEITEEIRIKTEASEEKPVPTPEIDAKKQKWSLTFGGELANYFISQSNPFFGERGKSWMETSLRLDTTLGYKNFSAGFSVLGVKTFGLDPFGTGTNPASDPFGAGRAGKFSRFYLDKAYIRFERIGGLSLKATLGRQYIFIGSQFLIGDGVYDGLTAKTQRSKREIHLM